MMSFGVEDSRLVGTCSCVPSLLLLPFLAILPVLLLCFFAQKEVRIGERWMGLARVGLGAGKLIILAVPLELLVRGAISALPEAQSSVVAWLGMFAFSFQLYLVLSGAADLLLGVRQLLGRGIVEVFGTPFWTGGFTDFWQEWNRPLVKLPGFRHAVLSLALVLLSVVIWRGASWGTLAWTLLHLVLISLERWRGKSLFAPLPLPIRAALTVAVVLVSGVLLFMPTLTEGVDQLRRLYVTSPPTAYSVLLDARLSAPWPMTCLWLAGLCCIALPPASWFLSQPQRVWRTLGVLVGVVAVAMLSRHGPTPSVDSAWAAVRHAVQWPLTVGMREGNADIFAGHEGWLYRQYELDRLTLKRQGPRSTQALLDFAGELRTAGVPLLVVAVPDKAALYPEYILPAEYAAPVHPKDYLPALERLRAAGIKVLDPSDVLWRAQKRFPLYFRRGSAWTPDAMKEVALATAKVVRTTWPAVFVDETPMINANILDFNDSGNLARDLDPWAPASLGEDEAAQLVSLSGLARTSVSPVLVLGGELTEVFEPQSAGFVTQLAALLGRSLASGPAVDSPNVELRQQARQAAAGKKLVIAVVRAGDL